MTFTSVNAVNVWEEISEAHLLYYFALECGSKGQLVYRSHLKFNYINFPLSFKPEHWFSLATESELLG